MKKKFSLKIISIYLLSSLLFFYLDELVFDNIFNAYTNFFLTSIYIAFTIILIYRVLGYVEQTKNVYETLIELSLDGIYIENEKGEILDCNKSGHEIFGYTKEEMLTKSIKDLVPKEFAEDLPEIIPDDMATGYRYVERINMKKNGTLFPTEINTKFVKINGEKRLIAFVRDISIRKKIEEELRKMAMIDELTDIYNRRYILKKLKLEVADSTKHPISVILLDLDDFKNINDCFGHLFGDKVLKKIAGIFKENLREGDYVGRYGGEEFIIILSKTNLEQGYKIISRLKDKVNAMNWEKENVRISFSAGIMEIGNAHSKDCNEDSIIKVIDILLYKAKSKGKNRIEMIREKKN